MSDGRIEEREACSSFIKRMSKDSNAPAEWREAWLCMADLVAQRPRWDAVLTSREQAQTLFPWEDE